MKVNWKFWEWEVWVDQHTGKIDWVIIGLTALMVPVIPFGFWAGYRLLFFDDKELLVAAATQPQSGTENKFGWLSIVIWSMVGLGVAALLIQNSKKISTWWAARQAARRAAQAATGGGGGTTPPAPTPSVWPIVAKWVFGVLGGLAVAYGLYLIPYASALRAVQGVNLPLSAYTVGIPVLILIIAVLIAAMKDGKTGSEKLKKLAELFGAFAKLGLTLAFIAVLAIFIVGPRMFWRGNYTPPPTPVGGAQAAPAVPATPVPQSRTITIPVGDLNAPLAQWSEEVRVVPGWSFRWDVVGQGGKMGVLVDGATRVVNEPTRRTDTHATQSLRFISLEGRPMQIAVSYYR